MTKGKSVIPPKNPANAGAPVDGANGKPADGHPHKTSSRAFWITIFTLFIVTFALAVIGSLRSNEEEVAPQEIAPTQLEQIISEAATKALDMVAPTIDTMLDGVYAPVYAAIPAYADFHYSVLGEYTELTQASMGNMTEVMGEKLFSGFEVRLQEAASQLDQNYVAAYQSVIQTEATNAIPADAIDLTLGPVTQKAINSAVERAKITVPLATVAMTAVGSGALQATIAVIAKKVAAKIIAKAAAKGIAKGGGVLAGAGGGALLCSWTGPGAAVCGVVGGVTAWLITDAVIVNLDEYFNRDEFEAELRQLIDEDLAEKKRLLMVALETKANELDATMPDFTLRDLDKTETDNQDGN